MVFKIEFSTAYCGLPLIKLALTGKYDRFLEMHGNPNRTLAELQLGYYVLRLNISDRDTMHLEMILEGVTSDGSIYTLYGTEVAWDTDTPPTLENIQKYMLSSLPYFMDTTYELLVEQGYDIEPLDYCTPYTPNK